MKYLEKMFVDGQCGPVYKRKCTDPFMCVLFFIFLCGLFATAAYGYSRGEPGRVLSLYDSDGQQCGAGRATEYKYLLYAQLDVNMTRLYCVKECLMESNK